MSKIQVTLTQDQVIQAIKEHVERTMPNHVVDRISFHVSRGSEVWEVPPSFDDATVTLVPRITDAADAPR